MPSRKRIDPKNGQTRTTIRSYPPLTLSHRWRKVRDVGGCPKTHFLEFLSAASRRLPFGILRPGFSIRTSLRKYACQTVSSHIVCVRCLFSRVFIFFVYELKFDSVDIFLPEQTKVAVIANAQRVRNRTLSGVTSATALLRVRRNGKSRTVLRTVPYQATFALRSPVSKNHSNQKMMRNNRSKGAFERRILPTAHFPMIQLVATSGGKKQNWGAGTCAFSIRTCWSSAWSHDSVVSYFALATENVQKGEEADSGMRNACPAFFRGQFCQGRHSSMTPTKKVVESCHCFAVFDKIL